MQAKPLRRLLKPTIVVFLLLALGWLSHQAWRVWQFENLFAPDKIVENFRSMSTLFDSNLIRNNGPVFELSVAPQELPQRRIRSHF